LKYVEKIEEKERGGGGGGGGEEGTRKSPKRGKTKKTILKEFQKGD